ncbi:MAG: hypothetical protein ACRDKB_03470 [Actinomycetota bacterium]
MNDELDLYAGPGISWKKAVAFGTVLVLVAGVVGYRWVTVVTPVTPARALDVFHEEQGQKHEAAEAGRVKKGRGQKKPARRAGHGPNPAPRGDASERPIAVGAGGAGKEGSGPDARPARQRERASILPEEGVYSWDTDGYERAGGVRRSFPEESQRIITRDGKKGWKQHHYFSEERESWTRFRATDQGAAISSQRNKVVFGPVTEDSTVTFSPPMLVGPRSLRVGQTWKGSWSGDTYGNYDGRTFEHRHVNIGGERVETWGVEVLMHMRGEIRGEVRARVWIAPEHGMTVKEDFVQDIEGDFGTYHAEWNMTLKSLEPRR